MIHQTPGEMAITLGEDLRRMRLNRNIDQITLAKRSGVALSALKRLEAGRGSTAHTLLCVVRTLGRSEWLTTVAPMASINPLTMPRDKPNRERASSPRSTKAPAQHEVG